MQVMTDRIDWNEPENFIRQQMRRVSRNRLIGNGVVVGLVALAVWGLWFYLRWFFHGPQLADDAFILTAAKESPSSLIAYVELHDRPLVPTGYVEESSKHGKVYSTSPYYFIAVGDKLMLVKADTDSQGQKLVGALRSISVQTDQQALDAIVAKDPTLRDRILPVMLSASGSSFNVFGYVVLGMLTPILVLCGYNIARVVGRGQAARHPVLRRLERHGAPEEVAQAIDAEMAEETVLKLGKAFLTRNWLLRPTNFGLIVCRLDDIVWAFHAIITGDNVVSLAFRDGRMMGVPLHRNTPEVLAQIYKRVPWAERGWDIETQKRWRTQRAAFLAAVDSRRE
jgi:hypothetical protein